MGKNHRARTTLSLPSPIEKVITPDVTRENKIEIGYRAFGGETQIEEMFQMNQK